MSQRHACSQWEVEPGLGVGGTEIRASLQVDFALSILIYMPHAVKT